MRKTPIGLKQAVRLTIFCIATMLLVVAPLSSPWAGTAQTAKTECLKQLGLSSAVCTCIGDRSERDLNPKQQKLFLAVVTKDVQARTAAQKGMTMDEMMATAKFMETVPDECGAP